ncbi:MAG: hypothetical protein QF793_00030 [Candidatus Peribacteraceae bacterium]|jgi:hypothetical protein|nr:hypothetical protein [bacterium]MDP6561295.1 hypothetical protein [Candidatus Peribacteraceae bacterium]|tara:strand:+ start:8769 stop:9332 length:564 start_codon:yes stop_codon:yes gene_type:complete
MKKRIALLSVSLLLTACGGGSGDKVSCDVNYWDGTFGTCLPESWEILNTETLRQRGVPEETIAAFQSSESHSGQFPTVAVTRERLANVVDPKQYSDANMRSVEVLDGYEHVDTRDFEIDGSKISLHVFTGQPIEGEPRRRFYQVSTTVEDTGYTVTAVSPVSINKELEGHILLILEQVTFEEPKEEE